MNMYSNRLMATLMLLLTLITPAAAQEPAEATMPESAPAIYQPNPLSQRLTASDVLEGTHGYVHPFLSIGQFYTDNLFNVANDTSSEWITVISPGIWISVPASRQPTIDMETVNTAPGGMQLSNLRRDPERRFQGYGLYRGDFRKHANFSEEETDTHRAEGQLYYRLRGGLAFEFIDIFELDQDPYGTGENIRLLDEFTSNLWRLSASYPITPKLGVDISFGSFTLDYDNDEVNGFRDRDDITVGTSMYFRILPKTSLIADYQFIDMSYDNASDRDSREHRLMGGVQWNMTAKSGVRLLLGYGDRNFDQRQRRDRSDFIGEARFDYVPSEKTKAFVRAVRRSNESDVVTADDILTHVLQAGVAQRLSARWSAGADVYFNNQEYRGGLSDRDDDYYGASLTFGYAFRRWLNLGFGYSYVKRSSNIPLYDYDTNSAFATLSASM